MTFGNLPYRKATTNQSNILNSLFYKGEIAVVGDFPTTPIPIGNRYYVIANLTDPLTGVGFIDGDHIYWNGQGWTLLGNDKQLASGVGLYYNAYNSAAQSFTSTPIMVEYDTYISGSTVLFINASGELTVGESGALLVVYSVTIDINHMAYQQGRAAAIVQRYTGGAWSDIPGSGSAAPILTEQMKSTATGFIATPILSGDKIRVMVVGEGATSKTFRTISEDCSIFAVMI